MESLIRVRDQVDMMRLKKPYSQRVFFGHAYNSKVSFMTFRNSTCFVLGISFNAITSPCLILVSVFAFLCYYNMIVKQSES